MRKRPEDLVTLKELAEPFSRHVCEHLRISDKQATSSSSRFLEACRKANEGELQRDRLLEETVRLGFSNVIDAFHVVNQGEVPVRFFLDERTESRGIRLTEDFFCLAESEVADDLNTEVEARWRLVETAWKLGLSRGVIQPVTFHEASEDLFVPAENRRINVTSSRDALNGYQKGRCFYCFTGISLRRNSPKFADVDHFFPKLLGAFEIARPIDGVWNLVLACRDCNRGEGGKAARMPSLRLLARLNQRNEYFIGSHHPLRETLIQQTGGSAQNRQKFLQQNYTAAKTKLIHSWEPKPRGDGLF